MRMITKFSKAGSAIYTSHLDVQRAFQMWLSRAGIPVRYSQGFNPHPVLSFAAALSLGVESHGEYADIAITEPVEEAVFLSKMKEHAPPGFDILNCKMVEDNFPSLTGALRLAEYDIDVKEWEITQELYAAAAKRLMESASYEATRRTKSGEKKEDIRPMIHSLDVTGGKIRTTLACSPQATLAPQVLAQVLEREAGCKCAEASTDTGENTGNCLHIIRRELLFATGGNIQPLL